jgi:hypothetical protein
LLRLIIVIETWLPAVVAVVVINHCVKLLTRHRVAAAAQSVATRCAERRTKALPQHSAAVVEPVAQFATVVHHHQWLNDKP